MIRFKKGEYRWSSWPNSIEETLDGTEKRIFMSDAEAISLRDQLLAAFPLEQQPKEPVRVTDICVVIEEGFAVLDFAGLGKARVDITDATDLAAAIFDVVGRKYEHAASYTLGDGGDSVPMRRLTKEEAALLVRVAADLIGGANSKIGRDLFFKLVCKALTGEEP